MWLVEEERKKERKNVSKGNSIQKRQTREGEIISNSKATHREIFFLPSLICYEPNWYAGNCCLSFSFPHFLEEERKKKNEIYFQERCATFVDTLQVFQISRDNLRLAAAAANVTEARGNSGRHKFPTRNMSIIHSAVQAHYYDCHFHSLLTFRLLYSRIITQ